MNTNRIATIYFAGWGGIFGLIYACSPQPTVKLIAAVICGTLLAAAFLHWFIEEVLR